MQVPAGLGQVNTHEKYHGCNCKENTNKQEPHDDEDDDLVLRITVEGMYI